MMDTQTEWRSPAQWREHLGFNQAEFADLAGCDQTYISKLETGYQPFNSRVGRRYLWVLENRGVEPALVDTEAPNRARKKKIEEQSVWIEDGYRATSPKRSLAEWRLARGLSQADLALLSGLNEQTIGRIERGENPTKPITRQRLAKVLQVRKDKLILPGDKAPTEAAVRIEDDLRAQLRSARHTLRKAYDFMSDDAQLSWKGQDTRDSLLPEIQRELKGS